MSQGFSRSLAAQAVATAMIEAARKSDLPQGAMVASPVLAEAEKALLLKMLARLDERRRRGEAGLAPDEVSSLFTFVSAKAAEAVTNLVNSQPNNFELLGMLDGKIPLYADERLTGYFKKLAMPSDCAEAYLLWHEANAGHAALLGHDPMLPLFEALKWCFRLSVTVAVETLEAGGTVVPGV